MTSLKTECRKFSPNIFNRSKCQNCFRGKDAHSSEALESNRATRKVSCCGYLFVAPDWDFSLPANRNKRWQRRWFVLYDDGELAYSLDEHPETVPQAVVDMNRVLEVSDAEKVTGNPFSLAVTCPDRAHFIKGTSREETKKWFEVLSKFPRNTVCGKYKRNATFPCIKSTPLVNIETAVPVLSSRRDTVDMSPYSKHNGYRNKPFHPDHYPTKDTTPPPNDNPDKKKQEILTPSENNCFRTGCSDPVQPMGMGAKQHGQSDVSKTGTEKSFHNNPVYLLMSDVPPGKKLDSCENFFGPLRRQASFGKKGDLPKWSEEKDSRTLHKSASVPNAALLQDTTDDRLKSSLSQIRGDPDGCNLDSLPSYCASTVELESSEGGSSKKGWLVKQEDGGSRWSKWWFVLRNSGLAFYSDPVAEDGGLVEGVVDLRGARGVEEEESSSGHSFCITTKDLSKLHLSAVTSKIRSNWIRAILQAANLNSDHKELALPPSPPLARTAISRVKERAKTRSHSRTRSPRPESGSLAGDSDEGTTSSSSLPNATPHNDKNPKQKEPKKVERRRSSSLKLESVEEGRRRVSDIKDRLEEGSWGIWLDVSKFCREVESRLEELELGGSREQRREVGELVASLGRVEERLHRVSGELEKAKATLMMGGELGLPPRHSSISSCSPCFQQQEVSRLGLAQQLNKIREENQRLRVDLKRAHSSADDFELACVALRKASEHAEQLHRSQMQLMVDRVDDLTSKLFASERSVRQLRQRVSKLEQRQERRRSSLKGKEGLSLSKEYEAKLTELEQKIGQVEGVMASYSSSLEPGEDSQDPPKESPSLLMRLHQLDRKVKDVSEAVSQSPEELPRPKIRLQVNVGYAPNGEEWNSLSLSASMTDLTDTTRQDDDPVSFADCLHGLGHRVSSLVSWLKMSLQLLYAREHMLPSAGEESEELGRLVRTLEFVTSKVEEPPSPDLPCVVSRLLYDVILLKEVTSVIFRMSDFEAYKEAVLVQHLLRARAAIAGIERYLGEKSSPVQSSGQKISLCNIAACLLFYRGTAEETRAAPEIGALFEEVEGRRRDVSAVLLEFKGKFIERFCTTILELSEDSVCDRAPESPDRSPKPLGQKQFLSHISHIVAQVSQSFVAHVSKSLDEVHFLCSGGIQYGGRWADYLCRLLQQELGLLSSEIKSLCVRHLENGFFSSSKCGVLVEYMHCSVSELAQLVAVASVVDGTVVLVKDAIYGEKPRVEGEIRTVDGSGEEGRMGAFHESVRLWAAAVLSGLPPLRFPDAFPGLCSPGEVGVAHRSVSSLLCFKHKWKGALEVERRGHRAQLDALSQQLAQLQAEQRNCRACFELRQEVSYLQGELEESRALARSGSLCDKCRGLRLEMQRLAAAAQEKEEKWRENREEVLKEKEKQFSEEKEKLERDLHIAQSNIKRLEHHYEQEMRVQQRSYEEQLRQKNEREDVETRYSEEIQQLKGLCERGVRAMESSHRRVVSELESRHQRELEEVAADRERALAEEAHATALALEAVRRAHSEELLKQVQKFKDNFILKMNKRFETEAFKKCYESDLSNVKHEILSMTEKYSIKCLENAALRERLEVTNQQLKTTTTQVVELLAKNEQLEARLTSGALQKQEEAVL